MLQERIKQPVQADIYPNWLAAINVRLCLLTLKFFCGAHLYVTRPKVES
jgi:hypothetical protein